MAVITVRAAVCVAMERRETFGAMQGGHGQQHQRALEGEVHRLGQPQLLLWQGGDGQDRERGNSSDG